MRLWRGAMIVVGLGLSTSTPRADSAPERREAKPLCVAPLPAMRAELERLFTIAGEHASHYQLCKDGDDVTVSVQLQSLCMMPTSLVSPIAVAVSYRVTETRAIGGECAPYPDCAKPPAPQQSSQRVTLQFASSAQGMLLTVPAKLPGLPLRTPLGRTHSLGCKGTSKAFTPRALPK